jgi:FKBP-type peptidyl-prolyl cis-trans isomerase
MKTKFGVMAMWLVVLILPFGLTSCINGDEPENPQARLDNDIETIDNYLASNNINAIKDPSGIRMAITTLGTGFPAQSFSKVDVDYIGKLFTDGTVFDEGNVEGDLANLIPGWQFALTTLPVGSKATLFIPSYWAYRDVQQGSIPPNSILIFNIAFNDVIETSAQLQKLGTDTVAVDDYLATKGIIAEKDTTGLRYVVTQEGTGAQPGWYDKVKFTAVYKLLTDDTKVVYTLQFEPSDDGFDSRVIDQIPNGLKQGLQKLRAGSKATFYLASGLGYGSSGASIDGQLIIPANANIIIEVDFTEIVTP